jgi:hypothetical protein
MHPDPDADVHGLTEIFIACSCRSTAAEQHVAGIGQIPSLRALKMSDGSTIWQGPAANILRAV